ncbi:site-specific DNA-methyltransferase [Prevotella melaninogenica]|uniref:site-specific DNA-methyltransferase n=1 Tax=Prevotella melaninogenica TaxID=28132 RepID=UPI000690BD2D|nr:site-specific DNA-methyltransferase [Prevotella melaninogenica]
MKPIRLETKSVDGTKINLEALYQIAPSCFTEEKDEETGEIKRVVNFETLRQLLGGDAVDEDEEMYQFTWPGKRAARYEAAEPIDDTLRPVPADSVDWDTTENLYIEGDNLRVLKLLQRGYMGKVKMIYIDPPYNTGNDFVYHDDFAHSAEEEDLAAGNIDEEGNRYRRNLDSNGRFHSDWCSMMYSRLLVARSLLKEDGVIFISIDDNEVHNLRKICDEVFGAGNFVGEVIWQSATDNNPRQISTEHEYLLCFAKQTQNLPNWLIGSENAKKIELQYEIIKDKFHDIKSQQEELRKWIKVNKAELKGVTHYNNIDEKGVYSNSSNSSNTKPGGYMFDIIHPITHKPCVKPAFGWRWTENTFWNYNANGDIEWGTDETTQPHVKKRISSVKEQLKSIYYEDGRVSTKGLEQLFEAKKIFDNPKPLKLIKRLINFTTQEDSLILDFFSGSATTAHAVMQLNAEDGGKRKYICVQYDEKTPEGSEARKAGYNTIPEIAKERIRRSAKQILSELDIQLKKAYQVLYDSCGGAIESPNPSGLTYFINNATLEQRNKFDKAQQSYYVLNNSPLNIMLRQHRN